MIKITRVCKECNNEFTVPSTYRGCSKYCYVCKKTYFDKHVHRKNVNEYTCQDCGKTFTKSIYYIGNTDYCEPCKAIYRYNRTKMIRNKQIEDILKDYTCKHCHEHFIRSVSYLGCKDCCDKCKKRIIAKI